MLMPVPQTLAKKLNKDVFQGEREREATCILSNAGHTSQTLSRPEKRQGQASAWRKKKIKTLYQVWQTQISIFNCCFGVESREEQAEQGTNYREKGNGYKLTECLNEWLPSYHSSIIRQLNMCCLQMLNKIKLSRGDLRVHIPLLL